MRWVSSSVNNVSVFLSFQQGRRVEVKGSPHACFFKRHLFRLDVNNGGVGVKHLAEGDGVGSSHSCALEDRLCLAFPIRGRACAE